MGTAVPLTHRLYHSCGEPYKSDEDRQRDDAAVNGL